MNKYLVAELIVFFLTVILHKAHIIGAKFIIFAVVVELCIIAIEELRIRKLKLKA